MLCFGGGTPAGEAEQKKQSKNIDKLLYQDHQKTKDQYKLLLLGPGESGKSTFFKQMKIISKEGGYTEEDRAMHRLIIYQNCITQMKVILSQAQVLGENISESNNERVKRMIEIPAVGDAWTNQIGEDIMALWKDEGIQKTYERRDTDYQLNDSAKYFFDNVNRFMEEDYLPTEDDILRARVRTTGIEEAVFQFDDMSFQLVDVGGQRSERRKWIHCFDSVTAVLFCSALSEYDQHLREDDEQNRMRESLMLFEEICSSNWFKDTPFILFLNKKDLFEEKILRVDLAKFFGNFKGPTKDAKAGMEFIESLFAERSPDKKIYSHFTCAVNTENVEVVFRSVRQTLMETAFSEFNF